MKKTLIRLSVVIILAGLFSVMLPVRAESAKNTPENIVISGNLRNSQATIITNLINNARSNAGLSQLLLDHNLLESAGLRSCELAIYFDHARPNGKSWASVLDSDIMSAAENIAAGHEDATTVFSSWMNSEKHKANILNTKATRLGLGCFTADETTYWVLLLADGAGNAATNSSLTDKTVTKGIEVLPEHISTEIQAVDKGPALIDPRQACTELRLKLVHNNKSAYGEGLSIELSKEGYKWSVDSETIGRVDEDGMVIPLEEGKLKVSAIHLSSGRLLSYFSIIIAHLEDTPSELKFIDVNREDWYFGSVYYAVWLELVNGKSANEFKPEDNMTIAEAIKLAACMHQLSKEGKVTLKNGEDIWYSTYVDYARENEIAGKAYEMYEETISREEYVHIFYNALPKESYKETHDIANGYIPDVSMTHPYAAEIYAFYRAGILNGTDANGTFNPEEMVKRSEVAAIICRMMDETLRK